MNSRVIKGWKSLNKLKNIKNQFREYAERFRAITDGAPVLLRVADENASCIFFNLRWLEFTGRTQEQEAGEGWVESVHPEERQAILVNCKSGFNSRQNFRMEYRLRRADGVYRWVADTGAPLYLPDGSFAGCTHSCFDIDEQKREEELLRTYAYIDGLTGMANRRYFEEYLDREWRRALRNARPLSLVMCGVNCLKNCIDAFGRPSGEECLKKVALSLCYSVKRPGDFVARYGIAVFAVVLPETDASGAAVMAKKLKAGVEALEIDRSQCHGSGLIISWGEATAIPGMGASSHGELVDAAEIACNGTKMV